MADLVIDQGCKPHPIEQSAGVWKRQVVADVCVENFRTAAKFLRCVIAPYRDTLLKAVAESDVSGS
jgi:hypothetical protein